MSAPAGQVVVAIKAVDEASSVMDKVRGSLSIFGDTIGTLGGGLDSLGNVIKGFAGAGVMGAASAAVGEVVRGLQDCFKSAKESEEAWGRLAAAVERSGVSWDSVKTKIEAFASSAEKMTRFSDEEVAKAMQQLVTYGMDVETAMKAVSAAMDLATAKQIPLAEAATALGKAYVGQETALTRMGVVIEGTVPKGEKFAAAMTTISEKFGAAAQKDIESYAGKQQQVANAMDNLKEKLGSALIPVMNTFQNLMGEVVKGVDSLVTGIGQAWKAFSEMPEVKKIAESLSGAFADLQKGFGTVTDALGKALLPIFKELWEALKGVWTALQPVIDAFGEIWKSLSGVSYAGNNAYTVFNLIADILKVTIVPALQGLVEVIKLVTPVIKLLAEGFKAAVEIAIPAIKTIIEAVTGFVSAIKETLGGFYKWLVGGSFVQETMEAVFVAFKEGFDALVKGLGDWLGGIASTFADWGKGLLDFFGGLWTQMIDIVGNAFKGILDAVKGGIDAISNFFGDLWKKLVGGSVWTDMWTDMVQQTSGGFDAILAEARRGIGEFEGLFGRTALGFSAGGLGAPSSPVRAETPGPAHQTVHIAITVQHMTGEVRDLENLTRMISRELSSAVKWRR